MALLEVRDLKTHFLTDDGIVKAVDGVSFSIEKGKTLGIVGESGCGKSVTCLSIMGLNPRKMSTTTGEALFKGENLINASSKRLREIRGNDIAMIFQDPMTSLNPVHKIGDQLAEAILLHRDVTKRQARARAAELLKAVQIPRAERRLDDYPHQFSGGMRQRAMIAMALVHNPSVLIADEPTTALDVTVQAQILELIERVKREFDIGVLLITHDLGVIAETADTVLVMYAGRAMEHGPAREIFTAPQHPYTWGLLRSMPTVELRLTELVAIEGTPPSLVAVPSGCAFHPRCPSRFGPCPTELPAMRPLPGGHLDRCHLPADVKREAGAASLAERRAAR